MMKKFVFLSLAAGIMLLASPLFAAAPACYSYNCADQTCSFNASCSTGSIWRVWYDFGDGNLSSNVSNRATVAHTYVPWSQGGPPFPTVKLTVISWTGMFTVSCQMASINNPFGPPASPTGICQ